MRNNVVSVAIIGAGNVATHLGRAFVKAGIKVCSVTARSIVSARHLADELEAKAYTSVEDTPTDVDYVVVCTTDASIADVAAKLTPSDAVVVHTSGSIELSVLAKFHKRCGVLYPLQTFSKEVEVDLSVVPFFIEGDRDVDKLASCISKNIYHADSERRKTLHIAGVLVSNFPIYLLQIVQRVLEKDGYDLDVVSPLINASIAKAFAVGPKNALTGPARRGDVAVINKHLELLSGTDADVYKSISNAILNQYHSEQNKLSD